MKKMRMDYKLGLPGEPSLGMRGRINATNHADIESYGFRNVMHVVLLRRAMVQIILSIRSERQK